jgi:hypothetical protein
MRRVAIAVIATIVSGVVCAQEKKYDDVICSYAPSQSKAVTALSGAAGGAGAATAAIGQALGLTAVAHSSGALILTGSGGYIAGTLGAAVIAPVIITAGAVIGGTAVTVELVCAPKNHPEHAQKVIKAAVDFWSGYRGLMVERASQHMERMATSFKQVRDDVFEYIYRY